MERQRKKELRDLNQRAWAGEDVFHLGTNLDSSLKKNTAFIKRLRTAITASSTQTFLSEIKTLSLHKYLSEIISACFEGLTKLKLPGDIAAGVEVFSALHQRFGPVDFTCYVAWHIGRGLSSPDKSQLKTLAQDVREKEEKERLSRHRILLRVATDLWLVGALRSLDDVSRPEEVGKPKESNKADKSQQVRTTNGARPTGDAEPFPLEVLKDLTAQDPTHANLPMLASFVKAFSWDLLSKRDAESAISDDPPLLDDTMQERFKNILVRYFDGAKSHLARDQTSLAAQSKRNAEAYVRSGEIFEDRQANYEKQVKAQDRFVMNMQILAEALNLEMPDLQDKDTSVSANDGNIGLVRTGEYLRGDGEGAGIWEDDDERRFYENLVNLKDRVPGILLEDGKKKKADADEVTGKKASEEEPSSNVNGDAGATGAEQSTAIASKTVGAQVDGLLARLPELTSKDAVDEIAVDFCFVNSKASRNRLLRAIEDVPKGRSDLLPLYSRLVATLSRYMPDVSEQLVKYLDDEFRSLQRRKQKDTLGGVRTSNIRYLAELTKFGVVPEHVIFHCLKVSLEDFSKMNIEIICNLLENCGRYLLRNPETAPRMKSFMETLQRKKGAQHIGQQERMLIENASYYVDPPERAAIEQKDRTPVDLFVRKLIYSDLTRRNIEKISKQLRKLHWEEQEVRNILHKVFVKPSSIRYSNVNFLAIILGQLQRYHPDFCTSVVDDLLESITFGLEMNDFRYNQRRIAEVHYLGQLYVYRLVDSPVLFEALFKITTLGHSGYARPGNYSPLDPPDDFFRIRLVANILESCGMYYEKGAARKKMDFFLSYFQYYILTKDPLPMDISFVVDDAFGSVRPQWKLASTLDEAGAAFAEAVKENYKNTALGKPVETEELDGNDGLEADMDGDDEADDDGRASPTVGEDVLSSSDAEAAMDSAPGTPDVQSDEDEEEHIVVTRPEDERDPEADAEFDREFAKMMAESVESRKAERRPMFDVTMPMRRTAPRTGETAATGTGAVGSGDDSGTETSQPIDAGQAASTMKFSLLSKKGNRPQTRDIDLPADSTFATQLRSQKEAEKAEQQRIKKLVLNYDNLRADADVVDTDGTIQLPPSLERGSQQAAQQRYQQHQKNAKARNQPQQGKRLTLSDVDWT